MKKLLLVFGLILALGAVGVIAQVYLAPLSYAGDPAPNPP